MNTITFKEVIRRWKKEAGTNSIALVSSVIATEGDKVIAVLNICTHGVTKWIDLLPKYQEMLQDRKTDKEEGIVNVPAFEKITFTESTWLV